MNTKEFAAHEARWPSRLTSAIAALEDRAVLVAAVRERDNTIARVRAVLADVWPEDGAGIDVVSADALRAALDPQETE